MGSALGSVLSVDKRVIFLSILGGMGDGHLDILSMKMDDGVELLQGEFLVEQILESVLGEKFLPVEEDGEPCVEKDIILQ